jgi:hypothetical protein
MARSRLIRQTYEIVLAKRNQKIARGDFLDAAKGIVHA